jgi:hypothetical protein
MLERDEAQRFVEEYTRVTGAQLVLVSAGERPDFLCKKRGRSYGLELVRAMRNPVQREWDVILGGDSHLHGLDAALLVQEAVYLKEKKRSSSGWHYPQSAILVIQRIGSDGEGVAEYLDDQSMDEMTGMGFREIWVADYSPMEEYGEIQLIGVQPRRWRGVHRHRLYGTKPYG